MADSIVRLKVDSKEYDSKLKRAAEGLQHFGENCRKAGESVDKADKEVLEYVQSIGKMDTVTKTAKGSVNEMTKAFTELSMQYRKLTEEEKQSPFGQALSQSLQELKGRIIEDKQALAELNRELEIHSEKVVASSGKMGNFGGMMEGIAGKFGMSTKMFTAAGAAVAGVGIAMKLVGDNVATAMNFEKSISQLSSLTGKTGQELEQLKEYAIELGGTTTLSASEVADAFKMIGSQQPQLLKSGEALRDVTKAAITLSEAAGIELSTAAQSLSTSINQFGGDSANAERFVNVLAAASQKGAGDIAFLGEAITKSGVLANAVGASYEELVANLEQLAQAGIDASTSGTALRGIIANLEKQSNDEYKPSVVGLTEAFHNLNEAHLTTVDYIGLAGKQFFSQAMVLAQNADKAKELTKEITGTNTAEEQAKTNTDNLDGSLKSLSSAWEALNLHINSSNGFLKTCVDWLVQVVKWADAAIQALSRVRPGDVGEGGNGSFGGGGGASGGGGGGIRGGGYGENVDATHTPPPAPPSGGSGSKSSKKGKKTTGKTSKGTGTHKETPSEKAEKAVAAALANYAQTITEADMRMEAGLDNTLDHQKKELAAQERLFEAYGKAYAIHADPKYKAAYEEAAEKYKTLAKAVADTEAEQKKSKETAKASAKLQSEIVKKAAKDAAQWKSYQSMSESGVSGYISKLKKDHSATVMGSSAYNSISSQLIDATTFKNLFGLAMQEGIDLAAMNIDMKAVWKYILNGKNIPDDTWQKLADEFGKKIGKDVNVDAKTGSVSSKKEDKDKWLDKSKGLLSNVSQISSGLQQMGIKVPDSINKVIGVMQGLMTVIEGVQAVISLFSTTSQAANTVAVTANTIALQELVLAVMANTATNFIPFAGGGVAHAAGGLIKGHHF